MRRRNSDCGAVPVRTCVGCGGRFRKSELDRYVWNGQKPVADLEQRLPGRGGYCCRTKRCNESFQTNKRKWKRVFRLPQQREDQGGGGAGAG